ncbi:MAG: HAD-IIA family hydrolase [Actinomycetota bacterium]
MRGRLRADGLVLDLDGVVYRGDQPIAGAAQAIERARAAGVRVVFCTNNSSATVAQYVEKLGRVGVEARPLEIVTSAVVTAEILGERAVAGQTAIVIGRDGVREALASAGVEVIDDPATEAADLVVVGWDRTFTWDAMRRAATAVRAGATLIATNGDATFPAPVGLWPGAGAILASIEVASGVRAEVMGKPHRPMMEVAARRLDGAAAIAMVGDRPETDLDGARSMGWSTVLVLSGVTDEVGAARLDPAPDLIVASLADLEVAP